MRKIFEIFLSFSLLTLFFAGCRPAAETERPADPAAAPQSDAAIRVSAEQTNAAEPAAAADADGNIYVVYVEHGPDKSADLYLQKFDQTLTPAGEKVRVNPEQGRAKAWFGDPPTIRIGADRTIFIGWTAQVKGAEKSSATDLFLSVSRDGGRSFDPPVKVNDDTAPASHGMHSLEIDNRSRVFVAWLDERNIAAGKPQTKNAGAIQTEPEYQFIKVLHDSDPKMDADKPAHKEPAKPADTPQSGPHQYMSEPNSEIFFAVSADGGRTFSPNIRLSGEVCPCCKTALAVDKNGKIYASWRQVLAGDFRHIAVASSENGGRTFSAPAIVSDDQWQLTACPVAGAPMVIDKDNNLKIFWFTAGKAGTPGLYRTESKDGGRTFSPRTLLYAGTVKGTPAVFDSGAVFDAMGNIFQTGQNPAANENFAGESPSAVFANGGIYTAFVRSAEEKKGVWLVRSLKF